MLLPWKLLDLVFKHHHIYATDIFDKWYIMVTVSPFVSLSSCHALKHDVLDVGCTDV